jgi:hypothetical protein
LYRCPKHAARLGIPFSLYFVMSEHSYDAQTMTQYLLGSLREAERAHFDELSITDDAFADALNVAEKDLVDAYVQGELSGSVLDQFNSHYLASPLRREKVKFAQVLQSALQKSAVEPVEVQAETRDRSSPKRKSSWWDSVFVVFTSQRPAFKWGLAAGIVALILAVGWMTFESARKRQQVYQSQVERDASTEAEQQKVIKPSTPIVANPAEESARLREERERLEREKQQLPGQQRSEQKQSSDVHIASFVLTPQMRSGSQLASISIPPKTTRIVMRLELEPNNHTEYRVSLLDEVKHQTLWRSGRLRARDGKTLDVNFRASLLRPRRYSLQVSGWSVNGESEPMGNYPFEVMR